jgi:nitroimidazol reductase NimA-like FMN-containing flavoprotein (pyridoxamine 5'-phosphate oxidase superfamily)
MTTTLSPTERTQIRRHRDRARSDRAELFEVLHASFVCHLGVTMHGSPVVIPTVFGVDPDGPDQDGTLYLHGSVAARSLQAAPDQHLCVTCTLVDGLVLARSAFHHSMNYRSAVVIGRGRLVTDTEEKIRALDLVVDHVVPGRSATLRPHTRKELAATTVIAVALHEASVKKREGTAIDDEPDVLAGGWAGVLPIATVARSPQTAPDSMTDDVPGDVMARAESLS